MNHKHSWDLIPWYVNGSVPDHRREVMRRHMADCAECRDEVEAQRALMQAMKTRHSVENMPHGSLQKLWARIDTQPPVKSAPAWPKSSRLVTALAAAVALQAVLLALLSMALLESNGNREPPAAYQTVSAASTPAAAGSVRAVFSQSMTLGELQALLERTHLRIVNGPSQDGVFTLATLSSTDDPKQALLGLRAHPSVQFAESITP